MTHMIDQVNLDSLLRRVNLLDREIEQLRRYLLRGLATQPAVQPHKPSLFGSVHAGDITYEMIQEARKDLFRSLDDL